MNTVRQIAGLILALALATVLSGSSSGAQEQGSLRQSQRHGNLTQYQRNQSKQAMWWRIQERGQFVAAGDWGVYGCSAVLMPWDVSVAAAGRTGGPPPVGPYTTVITSAQVANPRDAVIWMDVTPDGHVLVGQGKPAWAEFEAAHNCAHRPSP
jgi:hypothetical protein